MTAKKILGLVLAVLFGGGLVIGGFTLVFLLTLKVGLPIWAAILLGIAPFVITCLMVGIIALILYLLEDGDEKSSKSNQSGKNRNAKG